MTGKNHIWDISPKISPATPVWPGDTPFERQILFSLEKGDSVELSSVRSTVHLGAHADAPSHFRLGGRPIDEVDLMKYLGPCYVHKVPAKSLIDVSDCKVAVESGAKRILFRTDTFGHYEPFRTDFTSFTRGAVEFLGQKGIILIGIDTPSVDSYDSKTLPAHQELYKYQIAVLEGLDLSNIEDGHYELIALPLRLVGFDASPVRAILRPLNFDEVSPSRI